MKGSVLLIFTSCAVSFSLASLSVAEADTWGSNEEARVREFDELSGEISALNLLRGLYLSKDQLDQLIPIVEEAVELIHERWKLIIDSEEYNEVSRQLRDALYTSAGPSAELTRTANALHMDVDSAPQEQLYDRFGNLERKAQAVLSDAQIAVIEQFSPCYIPPQRLKDPMAVGQASSTELEEKELDLVRRMPATLYAKRRGAIIELFINRSEEERSPLPDDARAAVFDSFSRKLDEIRGLSAADFELKRHEYVQAFRLFDDSHTHASEKHRYMGKVRAYLLNRQMLTVMKKWRATMPEDAYLVPAVSATRGEDAPLQVETLNRYAETVAEMANRYCAVNKVIGVDERDRCLRELDSSRKCDSLEERCKQIDQVAQRLNEKAATLWSVAALFPRARFLCAQKGLYPVRHNAVTGLNDMLEEAHEALQRQDREKAQKMMREITAYIEGFTD